MCLKHGEPWAGVALGLALLSERTAGHVMAVSDTNCRLQGLMVCLA